MTFDAKTWLNHCVRTSQYALPDTVAHYGDLKASAQEVAAALAAVTVLDIDQQPTAALLPARVPVDVPVPDALLSQFDEVVDALAPHAAALHPSVRHALLACALHGDGENRDARVAKLAQALFSPQSPAKVFQPTVTWLAFLQPEHFTSDKPVAPTVRGGQYPLREEQGILTSITLNQGKIRINPQDMFTWTRAIDLSEAKIPANVEVWERVANEAWSLPYPPVTSLWLMGLGRKSDFWDFIPAGAALYSPFYQDGEVDAIAHNMVQASGPGFVFRPGLGIADIYPLKDDAVLAGQFNAAPVFDAAVSLANMAAIANLIAHPGCPVGLPSDWAARAAQHYNLAKSLELIPPYSAFAPGANGEESYAGKALVRLAETGNPADFKDLLTAAAKKQESITSSSVDDPVDAGVLGIPVEPTVWPVGASIRHTVAPAVVPVYSSELN